MHLSGDAKGHGTRLLQTTCIGEGFVFPNLPYRESWGNPITLEDI